MLNLVSNSLKFTDKLGRIIVQVKFMPRNEMMDSSDKLLVSIIDNGIGIKKKHQKKLFKLFGSIKSQKKKFNVNGIGLGLVICKMIVRKFGGHIDFTSKYKQGSTFFYTFEIEDFQNDYKSVIINAKGQSSHKTVSHIRILLVDDEEFCQSSFKILVQQLEMENQYTI